MIYRAGGCARNAGAIVKYTHTFDVSSLVGSPVLTTDTATYDIIGRTYHVGFKAKS